MRSPCEEKDCTTAFVWCWIEGVLLLSWLVYVLLSVWRYFIVWDQVYAWWALRWTTLKVSNSAHKKYAGACSVVSLLRACTLDNSSTAVANNVHELHTNEWLLRHTAYLSDCERQNKRLESFNLPIPQYNEAPLPPKFPTPRWFASVLVRDIMERMPELLAAAISIYGTVLKIDSTKKITNKRGSSKHRCFDHECRKRERRDCSLSTNIFRRLVFSEAISWWTGPSLCYSRCGAASHYIHWLRLLLRGRSI